MWSKLPLLLSDSDSSSSSSSTDSLDLSSSSKESLDRESTFNNSEVSQNSKEGLELSASDLDSISVNSVANSGETKMSTPNSPTPQWDSSYDFSNQASSGAQATSNQVASKAKITVRSEVPYGIQPTPSSKEAVSTTGTAGVLDQSTDTDESSTLKADSIVQPLESPKLTTPEEHWEDDNIRSPAGSNDSMLTAMEDADKEESHSSGARMKDTNPLNQNTISSPSQKRKPPFSEEAKRTMLKGTQTKKVSIPAKYLHQINSLEDQHESILTTINGEVELFIKLYNEKSLEY